MTNKREQHVMHALYMSSQIENVKVVSFLNYRNYFTVKLTERIRGN